ncbi:lipase family protein [Fructilactobacillus carniphilus]|uniref:Lipase family protein n=1 Tax=Fructilactobacillus carniphilus TaxID=2940297 RepID=A0ABY5BXB2_9LACO|nr:lipase family protein [Fructilactobacillus carniphilus]USS90283.1 lipase family protein [Fructilactobacillus carniphilus]
MKALSDKTLWNFSKDVYGDSYKKLKKYMPYNRNAIVIGTTAHTNFEAHGLQASLIKVDGQYVVACRGTAGQLSDFVQDGELANPEAYKQSSQFTDLRGFVNKMQKKYGFNPKNLVFTGHSLGGALASYGAVTYNARATTFSAPKSYNELSPKLRKRATSGYFEKRIVNYKNNDDIVSDVPGVVPNFSKQHFLKNENQKITPKNILKYSFFNSLGISGHFTDSFSNKSFDKHGKAIVLGSFHGNISHDLFVIKRRAATSIEVISNFIGVIGSGYLASKSVIQNSISVEKTVPNRIVESVKFGAKFSMSAGLGIISADRILVNTGVALSSIGVLEQASNKLDDIEHSNNKIVPKMNKSFNRVKNEFIDMFDIDVSDIVEKTINRNRLRPQQVVSESSINEVNKLIVKQKRDIDELESGIKKTTSDQISIDTTWAGRFNF